MKATNAIPNKIFTLENLKKQVAAWRVNNKTIAFSNGCFDILHEGHLDLLKYAKPHRNGMTGFTHFNKYYDDDALILK